MVIEWKEREDEQIDQMALEDPNYLDALGNCGLLKFFLTPGLQAQPELLHNLISLWDVAWEVFVIHDQELGLETSDIYFISGMSRRGEPIQLQAYLGEYKHVAYPTLLQSLEICKRQDRHHDHKQYCIEGNTLNHQLSGWGSSTTRVQQIALPVCCGLHGAHRLQLDGGHEGKHETTAIQMQSKKLEAIWIWLHISDLLLGTDPTPLPYGRGEPFNAMRSTNGPMERDDAQIQRELAGVLQACLLCMAQTIVDRGGGFSVQW